MVVELIFVTTEELLGGTTASGFSPPESGSTANTGSDPKSIYRTTSKALGALTKVGTDADASAICAVMPQTTVLTDVGPPAILALGALTTVRAPPCISLDLTGGAALASVTVTVNCIHTSVVVAFARPTLEELSSLGI